MQLYRFRLTPESPWRTPWQSDTLAGLLCWMCARTQGDAVLQREIIEPALAGQPPFVLSDAFPGDRLPLSSAVRLLEVPVEQRKNVKRAKWLPLKAFSRLQRGELPTTGELIHDSGIHEYTQLRNAIGRSSSAGGDGLFPTQESVLSKNTCCLTIYARIEAGFVGPFWELVQELAQGGFGSDRSAGKGQFRVEKLERVPELDTPEAANACAVLSTFQPAANDPTDGAWETFTKYGKLGPDFGLENVFKRPLIVLKPGACFRGPSPRGWIGRAVPMQELLASDVVAHLNGRGANVIHWAFGLTVPMQWPTGELQYSAPVAEVDSSVPALPTPPPIAAAVPVQPPLPPKVVPKPVQDPNKATVKVLERHDLGGRPGYFVQESGKPRGVLAYGMPPPADKLPQIGDEIEVYRNNQDMRSPQYRWDRRVDPPRSKGGPQRGKR